MNPLTPRLARAKALCLLSSMERQTELSEDPPTQEGDANPLLNWFLKTSNKNEDDYSILNDDEDFGGEEDENITFNEDNIEEELKTIVSKINEWKINQPREILIHKQNLLIYNICDLTLDTLTPLTVNMLNFLRSVTIDVYNLPEPAQPPPINLNSIFSYEQLRNYYNKNKINLQYYVKKIIKTYINNKYEEKLDLFNDKFQKENDYKLHFIAPLFKALLSDHPMLKKEWGDSTAGKTRVDGLFSIVSKENIITPVCVVEVVLLLQPQEVVVPVPAVPQPFLPLANRSRRAQILKQVVDILLTNDANDSVFFFFTNNIQLNFLVGINIC